MIPGVASAPWALGDLVPTRLSLRVVVAVAGVVFASQAASTGSGASTVMRTQDGSASWETMLHRAACGVAVAVDPDPTDPHEGGEGGGNGEQDGGTARGTGDGVDRGSQGGLPGLGGDGVFSGAQSGSLVKVTSAGANGSLVAPGQTINVTITWNPKDFGGFPPSKTVDCVKIGSKISSSLSQEHKPGPSGGTDHFSYVVPLDGTGGDQICDRAIISGPWQNTEKSAILCYTVMGVATPEVPKALMLPVAAMLVGGGGLLIARRRRIDFAADDRSGTSTTRRDRHQSPARTAVPSRGGRRRNAARCLGSSGVTRSANCGNGR